MAEVLQPSTFRVCAHAVIVGLTVSSTTIVWLQTAVFPQASDTVHVRVTVVGQVPEATSI